MATRKLFRVSTHSRLKAAGVCPTSPVSDGCFNTQPPEGGWGKPQEGMFDDIVSTHSRLKAAVSKDGETVAEKLSFQHTAA